ncbi:adenine/guanine permease AZG2 [Brachypodium distachyon]|uniref:Adenine/guanine permease AZG2 n=1 Tax=Brachypodium distachyon TaxID=15368 RepID=I1ILW9_BRADI|nr:adenine/guanine permease AZG2 [Brachypodium distachyon]KQJ88611.1 hypothetical protein BRADI_4g19930v3 [Brachypodium distachyon]|eukprot:XP_003577601.1 adenine/guanine permease AZG2 [Brachypodium distachyon]
MKRASPWHRLSEAEAAVNRSVAASRVGKYFKLEARKSSFTKELRAGAATFLTMAYIISVNAAILTDSGGPCTARDCTPVAPGGAMPGPECTLGGTATNPPNPGYQQCLARTKSDLIVATAVAAMAGSFAMGALANLPLALAPGMGANAYFAYNMVGFHGSGSIPYRTALAGVMLEGIVFFFLSAVGIRSRLARMIPRNIRLASAVGIGLFLAFTGLQANQGVGLVGSSPSTLVTLTACSQTDPATGACLPGTTLHSPTFWLGVAGFLVTATCLARNVKGGMIYGIVAVTAVSWVRGTSVTVFPDTPAGDAGFSYFKKVVDFHMIGTTAGQLSFGGFRHGSVWLAMLTLLYVDVLDTTGTMYSMAEYGGFTDGEGGFEGEYRAFLVDAGSTVLSAALGSTTVTTYIESTAGIREGGRTGVTAITVSACFLASLFFSPLLTSVPPWAVGPSLVLVGAMMMRVAKDIEWGDMKEAIPAFVTMALMPLTFSIANGIIAGLAVYVALNWYDWARHAFGKVGKVLDERRIKVAAASTAEIGPAQDVV